MKKCLLFCVVFLPIWLAMSPSEYRNARAFFSVNIEKTGLRAGDSCKLSYSMYIPEAYPVRLRFSAIPEQLTMINRQIRRAGVALSASTLITKDPKPIKIDGQLYREHRIWESYCMPLRGGAIIIPPMNFTMEVRDPRGRNYRVFRSEEVIVSVDAGRQNIMRSVTSIRN